MADRMTSRDRERSSRDPNIFQARYFENGSRYRLGFIGAPSPSPTLYKSCKKFTWRIYALSERLLVVRM